MNKVTVRIDSSRPVFIEADADNFGQVFANMSDEDQVNVLRAMVEHMKPHRIQWDYISIALEKDENRDVREQLSVILPDIAAKDAQIDELGRIADSRKVVIAAKDADIAALQLRLTAVEHSVGVGADVDHERDFLAMEARRYASHYPEASDGRNTFIIFAEMIEARAALKEKADA